MDTIWNPLINNREIYADNGVVTKVTYRDPFYYQRLT